MASTNQSQHSHSHSTVTAQSITQHRGQYRGHRIASNNQPQPQHRHSTVTTQAQHSQLHSIGDSIGTQAPNSIRQAPCMHAAPRRQVECTTPSTRGNHKSFNLCEQRNTLVLVTASHGSGAVRLGNTLRNHPSYSDSALTFGGACK